MNFFSLNRSMKNPKLISTLILSISLSLASCAEDNNEKNQDAAKIASTKQNTNSPVGINELSLDVIKQKLEKALPGIAITDIEVSPYDGMYQVFYNGQLLYVSKDAKFLMTGNLLEIRLGQPVNHTELSMAKKAAEAAPDRISTIASIDESDMVVFKAKDEKHAITVFTDVDCGYCRKLHKEVPELNAAGVTVRYLAFPRAGLGSSAHKKLVSIWCAKDRQSAMNDAKLKRKFSDATCDNPLDSHYQLTREFGLSGTPALILSDGELISGYVPHEELIKHLQSKKKSPPLTEISTDSIKNAKDKG
jgi:thiol:disulfide interchange protein DsbC